MNEIKHAILARRLSPLPQVAALSQEIDVSPRCRNWMEQKRRDIARIIAGEDPRLLVIVGPCSIHDTEAGIEYAQRLSMLSQHYQDKLLLVMRTYFEKPRTRHGWKGLLVDPQINGSYCVSQGLRTARQFLKRVLELGVATATEFLDTTLAPYMVDLICWGAIGARTVASQPHRQLASALPCAIGFKNSTDGNIDIAIDAIHAASIPQLLCVFSDGPHALLTEGNRYGHLILRGGRRPNYGHEDITAAVSQLQDCGIANRLIVDCSHGNSGKKAVNQPNVARNIVSQLQAGEKKIAGIMLESFLTAGNQSETDSPLVYGKSITDDCLGWDETKNLLEFIYQHI